MVPVITTRWKGREDGGQAAADSLEGSEQEAEWRGDVS